MLQAQVNYWTLQENHRHNVVMEDIGYRTIEETVRHNKKTESQKDLELQLGFYDLSERTRHNKAQEQLGLGQLKVSEGELEERQRHQRAQERIETGQLAIGWAQVDVAKFNAAEMQRHNQQYEDIQRRTNQLQINEQTRHNQAVESETHRHNVDAENVARFQSLPGISQASTRESELAFERSKYERDYQLRQSELGVRQQEADAKTLQSTSSAAKNAAETVIAVQGFTSMLH